MYLLDDLLQRPALLAALVGGLLFCMVVWALVHSRWPRVGNALGTAYMVAVFGFAAWVVSTS